MTDDGKEFQAPQPLIPQEIREQEEPLLSTLSQEVATLGRDLYNLAVKSGNFNPNDKSVVVHEEEEFGVDITGADRSRLEMFEWAGIKGEGSGKSWLYVPIEKNGGNNRLRWDISADDRQRYRVPNEDLGNVTWYEFMEDGMIKKTIDLSYNPHEDITSQKGVPSEIESMEEYTLIGLSLQRFRTKLQKAIKNYSGLTP